MQEVKTITFGVEAFQHADACVDHVIAEPFHLHGASC